MNTITSLVSKTFIDPYRGEGYYKKICGVLCAAATVELVTRAAATCFQLLSGNAADIVLRETLSYELGAAVCGGLCTASVLPAITKVGGTLILGISYVFYCVGIDQDPKNLLICKTLGKVYACAEKILTPIYNHVIKPFYNHVIIPIYTHAIVPLARAVATIAGKIFCLISLPSNPFWVAATVIVITVIVCRVFKEL